MAYINDDEMLCVERLAAMLHVSKSYIYIRIRHEIPTYKPTGKRLYFFRKDVNEWVRRNGTSNAMTLTNNNNDEKQ